MRDPFDPFYPMDPFLRSGPFFDRFPYDYPKYPMMDRTTLPVQDTDGVSEEMFHELTEKLSKFFDQVIGKLKKIFKIFS